MKRLVILLALACGKPPEPEQPPPPPPPPPCEEAALTQPLEVPLGGYATLAAPDGSRVTGLDVTSSGTLGATRVDATHWRLKAPYEPVDVTVKLALQCAEAAGTAELHAVSRAPKWSPLSQWT